MDIFFESDIRLFNKYTRRNVNNFNKQKCYNFARCVSLILLLSSADFFKMNIFKASFRNTIRVSNDLYPEQARRSVGADLGTSCLQTLSEDTKSRH